MNLFKKLFSTRPSLPPADLSQLHTDIHSHLIPAIDDGAKSLDDSLDLGRGLFDLGYKKVITTPHIMSDYYKNTPEIILSGLERVKEHFASNNLNLEIEAAAEYYLEPELESKIERKELLTFGDNYFLFELSFLNPPENLESTIFELQTAGYKPVMAHPERYPFWYDKFEKYHELKERGVILQLNFGSLTGHYSMATKKIAERMIDENLIQLLGSDTHHLGHIQLMNSALSNKHLHQLLNSGMLLNHKL